MPNLSDNRFLRLFFLCALYVAQGLPFGFVTVGLHDYFLADGKDPGEVAKLITFISIPWTLKFLWGPVIDRWTLRSMGRRRPWLILAQGIMVVVLLILAFATNLHHSLTSLGWAILTLNIFIALQDVSTDGLAVDLIPESDRGKANGLMYGCSYLGSFIGAAGVSSFLDESAPGGGMKTSFLVLAGCVFLVSLLPLLLRERKEEKLLPWTAGSPSQTAEAGSESFRQLFRNLWVAFGNRPALLAVVFAILSLLAYNILYTITTAYFQKEFGWDREAYSKLKAFAMWFAFGGSLLGGVITDVIGIKRAVVSAGLLMAAGWVGFWFCQDYHSSQTWVYWYTCSQTAFSGMFSASMFSFFMSLSHKKVGATQFTAYMAMLNVSIGAGAGLVGWAKDLFCKTPDLFLACAGFQVVVALFVALFIPLRKSRTD